jgi:fumarylacetoacetase
LLKTLLPQFLLGYNDGCLEPFEYQVQNKILVRFLIYNKGKHSFDIHLEVAIQPENKTPTVVNNFKHMYWTMSQQLTHHTSNGCRVNSGDMMGSGTISGPTAGSFGSMLELGG